jgi:outer membrane protein assembly factor BamA
VRWLVLVSLVGCAPSVARVVAPAPCVASRPAAAAAPAFGDKQAGPITHVAVVGLGDPAVTERLVASLRTEPGQLLDEAPLADDLRTLWRTGLIADARVEVVDHDVTFAVTPHPLIDRVSIAGAPGDARELRRLVWLAGTPLDPSRVQRTVEVARDAYRHDGYIDASIDTVRTANRLCFDVRPGNRFLVDSVYLVGVSGDLAAAVGKAIATKPGEPLNQEMFERDQLVVGSELWGRGYMAVKVGTPKITRVKSWLEIAIPVDLGPVFHFGDVQLGGVMHGPVAGLSRGELASRSRIDETRDQLQARFGDGAVVVPQTKLDREHGIIDLTFEVTWKN